jgi:predicted amino acid dehydrogenase
VPAKNCAPQPPVNQQPFFNAVQQLVDNGTITATEGQVVDSQIADGTLDTDTLASRGFTSAQLEAVQAALANTKRALAGGAATRNRPGVRQKKP